jgi:hypothetical protein
MEWTPKFACKYIQGRREFLFEYLMNYRATYLTSKDVQNWESALEYYKNEMHRITQLAEHYGLRETLCI